jgi:hypothetical protein
MASVHYIKELKCSCSLEFLIVLFVHRHWKVLTVSATIAIPESPVYMLKLHSPEGYIFWERP